MYTSTVTWRGGRRRERRNIYLKGRKAWISVIRLPDVFVNEVCTSRLGVQGGSGVGIGVVEGRIDPHATSEGTILEAVGAQADVVVTVALVQCIIASLAVKGFALGTPPPNTEGVALAAVDEAVPEAP